ncbi:MAG: DUF3108 domain-containing protein [Terricaulis sp.]
MRRIFGAVIVALSLMTAPASAEVYRLTYQAQVLGVVVLGTANYEVAVSGQRYALRGGVRTSGMARMFDQTQITATTTGTLAGPSILWSRFDLSHAYANKFRRVQMTHAGSQVATQIAPVFRDQGHPPASAAQRANSFDPLTAIFALGRQVAAARACNGSALVFDGRGHYRLSVTPIAQVNYNSGGYNGPALQCQFHYQPIAGFPKAPQHVPAAQAWFALQPGFAAPLRIQVPTPVGIGVVQLASYQHS